MLTLYNTIDDPCFTMLQSAVYFYLEWTLAGILTENFYKHR